MRLRCLRVWTDKLPDMVCLAWVSPKLTRNTLENGILTCDQAGLATYCALMTATDVKHGGLHEWDSTAAQVHQALYVRISKLAYCVAF